MVALSRHDDLADWLHQVTKEASLIEKGGILKDDLHVSIADDAYVLLEQFPESIFITLHRAKHDLHRCQASLIGGLQPGPDDLVSPSDGQQQCTWSVRSLEVRDDTLRPGDKPRCPGV